MPYCALGQDSIENWVIIRLSAEPEDSGLIAKLER